MIHSDKFMSNELLINDSNLCFFHPNTGLVRIDLTDCSYDVQTQQFKKLEGIKAADSRQGTHTVKAKKYLIQHQPTSSLQLHELVAQELGVYESAELGLVFNEGIPDLRNVRAYVDFKSPLTPPLEQRCRKLLGNLSTDVMLLRFLRLLILHEQFNANHLIEVITVVDAKGKKTKQKFSVQCSHHTHKSLATSLGVSTGKVAAMVNMLKKKRLISTLVNKGGNRVSTYQVKAFVPTKHSRANNKKLQIARDNMLIRVEKAHALKKLYRQRMKSTPFIELATALSIIVE